MYLTRLTEMNASGFFEIRLESIGGLGANLAGKLLAEAGVLKMGLNGWNASSYGSEKKGSPVKAFIRFANADNELRTVTPVEEPHLVCVFHEALFKTQDCTSGLQPDGILLVNTKKSPPEIREEFHLFHGTVACVDALQIALEEKTRINTAILGAICRLVPFLHGQAVEEAIRETFEKKYPHLVKANLVTFQRGFEEVVMDCSNLLHVRPQNVEIQPSRLDFLTQPIGGVVHNPGNSVYKDLSASRQGFVPGLKLESCIHCAACDQVCPDNCFVWAPKEDNKGRLFQFLQGIDYQYCKGCLKCVEACPTDALERIREEDRYEDATQVKHAFHFA